MEYRKLGKTNEQLSVLGFGASPLGNVFDVCEEKVGVNAVHYAIDHGVNFFDVSPFYGITLAETRLGKALVGKRKNIFLATKCGRYDLRVFDFSTKRIMASIDESLQRLKTDYVDLFQLHDIEFVSKEQILNEAMPAIEKIKAAGKTRFIGISGLPVRYLAAIARQVELDTVLSWAHYNLLQDEINNEYLSKNNQIFYKDDNTKEIIIKGLNIPLISKKTLKINENLIICSKDEFILNIVNDKFIFQTYPIKDVSFFDKLSEQYNVEYKIYQDKEWELRPKYNSRNIVIKK
jgi:predicted aldo/keto reductase-like oxidoreductase